MGPTFGAPIMGLAPLVGTYGGYRGDNREWLHSLYSASRDEASLKEFSLHLVFPIGNIGGVIGNTGVTINFVTKDDERMATAITNLLVRYQFHPRPTCMTSICMANLLCSFSNLMCYCIRHHAHL